MNYSNKETLQKLEQVNKLKILFDPSDKRVGNKKNRDLNNILITKNYLNKNSKDFFLFQNKITKNTPNNKYYESLKNNFSILVWLVRKIE